MIENHVTVYLTLIDRKGQKRYYYGSLASSHDGHFTAKNNYGTKILIFVKLECFLVSR